MASFTLLEIVGALIGLLYVILEYRANVWLWPVGVVMPAIYIYIYYQAGIYADMGINVYFLVAAIYGWVVWQRSRNAYPKPKEDGHQEVEDATLGIVRTSRKEWFWCSMLFAASFALLAYILVNYTSSSVPYSDSFTTALSIVGMWMLAHKRVEHWVLWIVVDAVSVVIYVEKGLYPTAILYAIYTVIAMAGYVKWLKLMSHSKC
ncbi:MAG: nicotinamide riboside transporter PnuC [Rikenellaceae bacterium]